MAAEVVGLIIPALPKEAGHDSETRAVAAEKQKQTIARRLHLWTNLAPSPVGSSSSPSRSFRCTPQLMFPSLLIQLVVLVVTVIRLERLVEIFPHMGADGE